MAKLKINKIEIAAAADHSEKLLKLLQRRGCTELTEPEELDFLTRPDKAGDITELDTRLQTVNAALSILKKYSGKKGGMLSSLNGREALSDEEYSALEGEAEELYSLAMQAVAADKELTDNRVAAVRLKTAGAALEPWLGLDIPLDCAGTKKSALIIGSVPKKADRETVLTHIARDFPDLEAVEAEVVYTSPEQSCFAVFCLKEDRERVEQSLREMGFVRISDPPSATAAGRLLEINAEIQAIEQRCTEIGEELTALSERADKLSFLSDYYIIERDRSEAYGKLAQSKKITVISGYVPQIHCERLKADIESRFDAAVFISEPSPDEDVPVVLKNNGFAAPVESITEMYSLPGKNDIDPTPIMAFFYYFFFGMMLSDAGYGLIIALATGIVLLKFKLEAKMRNTVKMYFFCGLSTVFWGAMYGSWFGDMPNVIGSGFFGTDKFASTALWIDPLADLMKLLVYCFIFGLVHLFVGVGIKTYTLWKQGHKIDGLCEIIPTAVLIFGFCPVFFGLFTDTPQWLSTVGTPALILGVILVIATAGRGSKSIVGKVGGGLYGLYNMVSGYLGDVLSYARLLALGLSTGVIAQVVNMLCTLPSNKILQVIMLVAVGSLGHVVNLGINLIGAYVHTNRLQYVEFFSKFYEGGGRALKPLKINTKTYKFKEDI